MCDYDFIIKSGLGTGKSTSVRNYIYNTGQKVLTITLLTETTNALYQSFKKTVYIVFIIKIQKQKQMMMMIIMNLLNNIKTK